MVKKKSTKSKNKVFYIDPEELTKIVLEWQDTGDKKLLDILVCDFFYRMATGIIQRYQFNLVDPLDAIQECVIACVNKADRFDPDFKAKPKETQSEKNKKSFSFFTSIIINHYRGLYRVESSYLNGKVKIYNEMKEDFHREHSNSDTISQNEFWNEDSWD